jgi:iron complex outermembrane receptor protein
MKRFHLHIYHAWLLGSAAASALAAPGQAYGQETAKGAAVDDIVVTAQRRETRVQTTSAAVTALSSTVLESARVRSVDDVAQLVPNVTFAKANNEQQISIRGVGVDNAFFTAEAGVAVYVDGIYLGRPSIATAALSDLERIEVVRGPQGTLYGRNATGGAVNIITKGAEDRFGGKLYAAYGNYDAYEIGGTVTGPIGSDLSARLSADYRGHDGYARNLLNGTWLDGDESVSVRGALEWHASDRLTFDLRSDYQHSDSTGPALQPYNAGSSVGADDVQTSPGGGSYVDRPRNVFHDLSDRWTRIYYGTNLTATYELDGATLKSITAYRHSYTNQDADLDGTNGAFDTLHNRRTAGGALRAHQISQEFQIASDSDGPINYLLGLYYYDEHARVRVVTDQFDFVNFTGVIRTDYVVKQDSRTAAAYGEVYYNPSEALRFTAGLRYTADRKSFSSTIGTATSGSNVDRSVTPKFGVEYKFSPDIFAYATASKGFKAGGFNPYTNSGFYKPETLWAYEVGLKTQFLDHKLQANLAAFYYDYADIQVTQYTGLGPDISNVGSAKVKGLELELQARPISSLTLGAAASYLDAEYGQFNVTDLLTGVASNVGGNQVTKSPKWSFSANAMYTHDLGSNGRVEVRYDISTKSSFYYSVFNNAATRQEAYAMQNAQISYVTPSDFRISAFIRNIADKAVFVQATQASALLLPVVAYNPPRTYGVSVSKAF